MWVRILGQKGNSETLVLPAEAIAALGWERGDHLVIQMESEYALIITKSNLASLPDRVLRALAPEPVIQYG